MREKSLKTIIFLLIFFVVFSDLHSQESLYFSEQYCNYLNWSQTQNYRDGRPTKTTFGYKYADHNQLDMLWEPYGEYFYDYVIGGVDSGHGTDKGNRLLAENIANTILKNITFH